MKNILKIISKSAMANVAIIFLAVSSLSISQVPLDLKVKNFDIILLNKSNIENHQIFLAGNYAINNTTDNTIDVLGDTIVGTPDEKIVKSNAEPENKYNQIKSIDSTKYSMFGDLLNDDSVYNKTYPIWIPVIEVLGVHTALCLFNRYIANADYGRIGFNSWQKNLSSAWEWDSDRFGMNFLGHPYSGGLNFMSARSNGYNFWQSIPFAVGGSIVWEYFGENTPPAYNDIVNTPISGVFYGEILYRLSSNLLDDRTTGTERFFREFGAAALSPTRFFNRLFQGKLTRVTSEEVYQKQPLNIELSAGRRVANDGGKFGTGLANLNLNVQVDYGYPLEQRVWKPFDYFDIRASFNFGVGRKIIENITGYGVLFAKNVKSGNLKMLVGGFQHYNYFDTKTFELGAIALGGGIMSQLPIFKNSFIFTNAHIGIVPLAGNSTRFGPDTSQLRDYNYGGGLEGKIECGVNLFWASIDLTGYYFWIHTFVGVPGDNYIGILKPRISVKLYQNLSIGFEQMVYYSDRITRDFGVFHMVRTEQRLYLTLNVGNFKL